jgi:hypothetical protein
MQRSKEGFEEAVTKINETIISLAKDFDEWKIGCSIDFMEVVVICLNKIQSIKRKLVQQDEHIDKLRERL